jgi:hypothetical protein
MITQLELAGFPTCASLHRRRKRHPLGLQGDDPALDSYVRLSGQTVCARRNDVRLEWPTYGISGDWRRNLTTERAERTEENA